MMYVLHWEYMAGSIVVQAILHDIGVETETRYVDMGSGEHRTSDYLRLNPTGCVPALTLPGGKTIGETGAIVTHLCETFPEAMLAPQVGDAMRPDFLFWLNVMTSAGYPTVARYCHPERYAQSETAVVEVEQQALADLNAFFDLMESGISGEGTFLSSGTTALDYYMSMLTEWADDRDMLLSTHPKLAAVYAATSERPAYRAAMNTHAIPKVAA